MFGVKKKRTLVDAGFDGGSMGEELFKEAVSENKKSEKKSRPVSKEFDPDPPAKSIHQAAMPRYVEAWGWAASAARFRGVVVILLLFVIVFMSVSLFMMNLALSRKDYFVVGIDSDGKPHTMERASLADMGPEMYVRDFVNRFLNYTHLNVENNMKDALGFTTKEFSDSWHRTLGMNFVNTVKKDQITQITIVDRIDIVKMEARQFIAEIWGKRYRSSIILPEVKEDQVKYVMEVFKVNPSKSNPWGYFVHGLKEETY